MEVISTVQAPGRRASQDVRAQFATPTFDSSAMDGYAVSSVLTATASNNSPRYLRVEGTIAAGDPPLSRSCDVDDAGRVSCVKIMTGAPFPQNSSGPMFDACIPVEHAEVVAEKSGTTLLKIVNAPKPSQHRRWAGDDFSRGDVIISKGTEIRPHHVMALTSLGMRSVPVQRRLKATVLTTGAELQSTTAGSSPHNEGPSQIADCNGPYLAAALSSIGVDATRVSGVSDDLINLRSCLANAASYDCDILITTGGVSAGDFDFVPRAITDLNGKVQFHHAAMRPGHPVLFALLPDCRDEKVPRDIPVFGLPGNPIAAAACYRFLVVPYIESLLGLARVEPICCVLRDEGVESSTSRIEDGWTRCGHKPYRKSKLVDVFRHGFMSLNRATNEVRLSSEQSPAKVQPFGNANCWVHIPAGVEEFGVGEMVDCYPF